MKRLIFITIFFISLYGCHSNKRPTQPAVDETPPLFTGTVGSYTELVGYSAIRVQGYSLVVGLAGTGSSECPDFTRSYLVQALRKLKAQDKLPGIYAEMDADQIIADRTTAVVMVSGLVPAGAPKGELFDVEVSCLEGSQTTSLQGGYLIETDLQIVEPRGQSGMMIAGKKSALANGTIFINPLPISADAKIKADPRRGMVLGGGRAIYDRRIELSLIKPDYRIAQQIQNRINERFTESDGVKVATASREQVTIMVPNSYRNKYNHFISLVWALYLQNSPGFLENKLRELSQEAVIVGADLEKISLAWEAIGRTSLKHLQTFYTDPSQGKLSFYAARTAIYLDDLQAIDSLIKMALDDQYPAQVPAAELLSELSSDYKARVALEKLLEKDDYRLQLIAYDGLRKTNTSRVMSKQYRDFRLDVVDTRGKYIIGVWATKEPRIALFGGDMRCQPNIFFESPDESLIINAQPADQSITISRRIPYQGKNYLSKIKSDFRVANFIVNLVNPMIVDMEAKLYGPGLSFSETVGLIYQFCENQTIPAIFQLQREKEDMIR